LDDSTSNTNPENEAAPAQPAPAPEPAHAGNVQPAAEAPGEFHDEMSVELTPDTPLAQNFDELELSPNVLGSVKAAGYVKPTPIQSLFIPRARTGRDVMGQAKTGTAKPPRS